VTEEELDEDELEDTGASEDTTDELAKELEATGDEAAALDTGAPPVLDSAAEETCPLEDPTELAASMDELSGELETGNDDSACVLLDIAATLELLLTGALLVFLELPDEPPPQATNASIIEQDIKPARYLFM
jgi:hypothetical protein